MDEENRKPPIEETLNVDHVADIKFAEQHARWNLTILGIWPHVTSNPTMRQRLVSIFMLPICPIGIFLLVGSIICHAVFRAKTAEDTLAVFGPIGYQSGNFLKSVILIVRRDVLKLLLEHVEANWRRLGTADDREIMFKYLKLGRGITRVCFFGLFGSTIFFYTAPFFAEPYINEFNQSVRILVFPGPDMLIDIQKGHNYEIVYFVSSFGAFFNVVVHLAIFNLSASLVTHACGQVQIVISRLDTLVGNVDEVQDNVVVQDRIAFIVRNHVRAYRFATTVENFLQEICLIEVLVSSVIICWFEYTCLVGPVIRADEQKSVKFNKFRKIGVELAREENEGDKKWQDSDFVQLVPFFMLLTGYSLNLFILCHVGELLKEQFHQIGKTSYMIDWHKLLGKTGLALVLVITMGNYPCKLTAGRMIELSYYSFGSIMRTSVAYLNMLRTVS